MTSDSEMLDVTGRVAMISGASRGIGAAIATRLLDDGYRVSLGVRDVPATSKVFAGHPPEKLQIESFDAADPATAERWIESTLQHFGELHALVNNAGIFRQVNFEEGSDADLDDLWEVNVKAPFHLTRLAMPALKQCGNGRIVNVASTDGLPPDRASRRPSPPGWPSSAAALPDTPRPSTRRAPSSSRWCWPAWPSAAS